MKHTENNKSNDITGSLAQASSQEIIHLVKKNDDLLTTDEKDQLWENISKKTVNQKRRFIIQSLSIAATVLVLLAAGWSLYNIISSKTDFYSNLAARISVDTLKTTHLYINEQEIELDNQAEIRCNAQNSQLQIFDRDGNSFKISVPDAKDNPYLGIAVPAGNKARIILADNSVITVREQSKLIFPVRYALTKREVYLEGEAFLNVSKNPKKQFNVKTKDITVSVLGTSFDVCAFPDRNIQSVVLVTGKVKVTPALGEIVTMSPNQKYIYDKSGKKNALSNIDPYDDICWKEDLLILDNTALSFVFEKLCKHYKTTLFYNTKEMENIKISGKLDLNLPLNDLLKMIEKIAPNQILINRESKTIKLKQ